MNKLPQITAFVLAGELKLQKWFRGYSDRSPSRVCRIANLHIYFQSDTYNLNWTSWRKTRGGGWKSTAFRISRDLYFLRINSCSAMPNAMPVKDLRSMGWAFRRNKLQEILHRSSLVCFSGWPVNYNMFSLLPTIRHSSTDCMISDWPISIAHVACRYVEW